MNFVGIDISIDSTAISILRNDDLIVSNFTTLKKNNGWIKKTMDTVDYEFINYTYKNIDMSNYSDREVIKIREYDHVTDLIYNKILGNINKKEKTIIAVEGYNYGLRGNSLIDIVSFSTLVRIKILDLPELKGLIIISPTAVKSKACEMTYGYTINKNGKKIINKSPAGISGGSFDKKNMLEAIIKLSNNDKLFYMLYKYKDELLKLKNVPKPIDDIVDANFLMTILKNTIG